MNVLEEYAVGVDITDAFPLLFFIVSPSSIGGDGGLGSFASSVFGDIRHVSRLTPRHATEFGEPRTLFPAEVGQETNETWPCVSELGEQCS
jgi:hypothetical protein